MKSLSLPFLLPFFSFMLIDSNTKSKSIVPNDFHCVIENGAACGHANAGSIVYVVNKDPNKSYKVTVSKKWTQENRNGSSEEVITLPAGGRKSLGCNRSSDIPIASWTFNIIGEE